jgi:thiosulfate dehydrogenase (quinone) large subunit
MAESKASVDRLQFGSRWSGYAWGSLRLAIGWIFAWSFLDKLFGLGFSTCRDAGSIDFGCDAAFVSGGSPTYGFLKFGTAGSHLGSWFDWMAPNSPDSQTIIDWLFMASLLFIGIGMLAGIMVRLAALSGALLVTAMYLAGFIWPEHNPFVDEHVLEILLLVSFGLGGAGRLSIAGWWNEQDIVKRYPILS